MYWIWVITFFVFMFVIILMIEHYSSTADQASALYDHHDAFDHLTYIGDKLRTHKIKYWIIFIEDLEAWFMLL